MPSVTRKSHRSRAVRRDETRDRLLGVVETMLSEGESFTEISVERIVSAAGMSRSTFYVYFEDKGDLLAAWFGDISAEIRAASADWWTIDGDATHEDLRAALERVVSVYHPHGRLMAATFQAAAYDQSVRELTDQMMKANIASLRKHIRIGQKAGFVDPELRAGEVAEWLTWMAERALHVILRDAEGAERARQVDAYASIVWNTLYRPTR